jgi:hypothetical protein
MRGHSDDCECRRCVMDREFLYEMAQPANHVADLDDVTPLPPAPGPTPEQLKRDTNELLAAERDKRVDREARDRRDGPILAAFDAMESGAPLASALSSASRHAPALVVVDGGKPRSRAKRRR